MNTKDTNTKDTNTRESKHQPTYDGLSGRCADVDISTRVNANDIAWRPAPTVSLTALIASVGVNALASAVVPAGMPAHRALTRLDDFEPGDQQARARRDGYHV